MALIFGLGWLVFALVPYAIGARGLRIRAALAEAPGMLWGRLGEWLRLGCMTGLLTALFTLGWSALQGNAWVAAALYPLLGTWLVGGAVVLCLPRESVSPPEGPGPGKWFQTTWQPFAGTFKQYGGLRSQVTSSSFTPSVRNEEPPPQSPAAGAWRRAF